MIGVDYSYYELYLAALRATIFVAIAFSVVVSLDRILHFIKYVHLKSRVKVTGRRPEDQYNFQPFPDESLYGSLYPVVAVQLPMFNETAVCQSIIDHACALHWPRNRLCIQVLDDSTDAKTRDLVDEHVAEWARRGFQITCLRRTNRQGYKAGALREGMTELTHVDYVAVFDADFKPEPDFLQRAVPYLHSNPEVGYVQARWSFTNAEESYLTKAQEISLNYHMKCEQWVHFASGSYFNFNGTAGVWRRRCIEDVGGWNARTTVEDMDLSLRAYLGGWKAVFLDHLTCLNELPSQFGAYRKQQHRWTCGPVQLWRKMWPSIWASNLPFLRKADIAMCYFGIRKVSTHLVSLGFFCLLVPLSMYSPEVAIPLWALVHLPIAVTLVTACFTPGSLLHAATYVLFENAMGLVKVYAVIAGLLDLSRAQEWVVTTKLGASDKRPHTGAASAARRTCTFYLAEALLSAFVLASAVYGTYMSRRWSLGIFLALQGAVLLAFALGWVDADGLLGRRSHLPSLQLPQRTKSFPVASAISLAAKKPGGLALASVDEGEESVVGAKGGGKAELRRAATSTGIIHLKQQV